MSALVNTFTFDDLVVTSSGTPSKPVRPGTISFDKKHIYAGESGNWRLNFADLATIDKQTIERDDYSPNGNNRRRGSYGSASRREGGGGTSSETMILTLTGLGRSLKCTVKNVGRGMSAKKASQLEAFVLNLKNSHRRVRMKNIGKDPYAKEETPAIKSASKIRHSGNNNSRVITPARNRTFLSPAKKKRSRLSEEYDNLRSPSPEKRRNGHATDPNAANDYVAGNVVRAPTTPNSLRRKLALPHQSPRNTTPLKKRSLSVDGTDEEDDFVVKKIRPRPQRVYGKSGSVVGGSGSGGRHKKLQQKINQKLLNFEDEEEEEMEMEMVDDGKNERVVEEEDVDDDEKVFGEDGNTDHLEDAKEVEGSDEVVVPKRRRLLKARLSNDGDDNDDLDVDFEEDAKIELNSCKKKLLLSIEDEEDDEVETGEFKENAKKNEKGDMSPIRSDDQAGQSIRENDDDRFSEPECLNEPVPVLEHSMHSQNHRHRDENSSHKEEPPSTMLRPKLSLTEQDFSKDALSTSSKSVTDDEKSNDSPATSADASEERSSSQKRLGSSPKLLETSNSTSKAQPKKTCATMHNFFAPRKTKSQPSEDVKHSSPSADTYGAILSSPLKKKKTKNEKSPLTPSRLNTKPSASEAPTPVPKQVQRKSDYFESEKQLIDSPRNSDNADYASGEGSIFSGGDYIDRTRPFEFMNAQNYYCHEENSSWEEEANYKEEPSSQMSKQRRPKPHRSMLGTSRLAARTQTQNSPTQRLDFGSNGDRKSNYFPAKRGLNFKPIQSESSENLHTAERALGKSGSSPVLVDDDHNLKGDGASATTTVPGIQNLGNTCYLSASLQTLFSVPNFIENLYKIYKTQYPAKDLPLTRSLLEAAKAVGVLSEESAPDISSEAAQSKLLTSTAANPGELKKQMDVLTNKFAGYEQRDAHEFLSDLVDFLHDELAAPKYAPQSSKNGKEIITKTDADKNNNIEDADGKASAKNKSPPKEATNNASAEKETNAPKNVAVDQVVLPTDDFFHLNVRVCLECDWCGYSR